jgi:TolB-like protein/DNA-binding winged helix-turn-helix (wHTH) protein/Flp pilus assembly protein TadD
MATAPSVSPRSYSFGEFTLDLERGALLHRGADIELRPKSFEVLRVLVERHGRLVTKQELLDAVWGRVIVTEGSVAKCLIEVRRAIDDRSQRLIKTVPRRGYIFDAPVTGLDATAQVEQEAAASGPSRAGSLRPWILAASFAVTVVSLAAWLGGVALQGDAVPLPTTETRQERTPAIAVLPLVDMSAAQDHEYLADGVAEEILDLLADVPAVTVIARSSSFAFKGRNTDIATIAATLNVTHVLEGSLRTAGNTVRVTARLVDATTSAQLWSATYERQLDDVFAVQRDIAGSVARTLRGTLDGSDVRELAAANGRVYERYLLGRFLFNRRQPGDLESAESAYRQAIELDASFAKAWAGLAGVYLIEAVENHVVPPPSLLENARAAVDEALRLDPWLAEAHVRRSGYFWLTGDETRYEEEIRIAAALAPEDPLVLSVLAAKAAKEQRLVESIDLQSRAVALDPLSLVYHLNLGAYLFYAGSFESAEAEWRAALELAGASAPAANELTRDLAVALGEAAVARQRSDSALALVESWLEAGKERDYLLALIYHALGRTTDANAAVARLREAGSRDEWASRKVIEVYAYLGQTDEAFEWLAKAANRIQRTDPRAPTTMAWKVELRHSPFVLALHEDPRWQAWLAEG